MKLSDYLWLIGLALFAAAIVLGKRKGRQKYALALASARADGRAELRAELSAIATANGGSVVINYGTQLATAGVDGDALYRPANRALDYDHRAGLDHSAYDVRPELVQRHPSLGHDAIGGAELPATARRSRVTLVRPGGGVPCGDAADGSRGAGSAAGSVSGA